MAELFPQYSRSRLAGWIKSGALRLDGEVALPRRIVSGDEWVTLKVRPDLASTVGAESIALEVRYQDADVLVINKPSGLTVHPGAGQPSGTLQNALLHFDPELAAVPRAGIVHRLDKDTSGVLVVARNLRAHAALVAQLQARAVRRQYLAVVCGVLIAGGRIDAPIGRHPRDRLRRAVVEGPTGKSAVTHYRVRERFRNHTLVECHLETGRTHQIRVHFAHLRHPLVGDALYGGGLKLPKGATPELVALLRGFRRQALHAERIEFIHPHRGVPIAVSAELPADLAALLDALRADARVLA